METKYHYKITELVKRGAARHEVLDVRINKDTGEEEYRLHGLSSWCKGSELRKIYTDAKSNFKEIATAEDCEHQIRNLPKGTGLIAKGNTIKRFNVKDLKKMEKPFNPLAPKRDELTILQFARIVKGERP